MSEQTNYSTLLSTKRFRQSEISNRKIILESESDRSRLVFSAPFRRLQQKAQVFSLESNAAVRSRLTHSLEVAQVGRFLSEQIAIWLKNENKATDEECRAFVNFVETACLMHDLGNPPFGHFGEAAIQEWFSQNGRNLLVVSLGLQKDPENSHIASALGDFLEFDGNCQGLRIATKLQWNRDEFGLNLTHTTLAAFLKYLRSPKDSNEETKAKLFHKKPGFFDTEANLVKEIWSTFNYTEGPHRFPLAYVMEAADDIAYCISDLEDSIEKELISERFLFLDIYTKWSKQHIENRDSCDITKLLSEANTEGCGDSFTFVDFRTRLSRLLTDQAVKHYQENHEEILSGKSKSLLSEESNGGKILEVLKNYCRKNVYSHYTVQQIELSGYAAIRGLLEHFGILLSCSEERFTAALNDTSRKDANGKAIIIENKLLSLFPPKHIKVYKHAIKELKDNQTNNSDEYQFIEWNLRAHLITDFISGMTDDFAMQTFQNLSGIKTQL